MRKGHEEKRVVSWAFVGFQQPRFRDETDVSITQFMSSSSSSCICALQDEGVSHICPVLTVTSSPQTRETPIFFVSLVSDVATHVLAVIASRP